jgi:hypothetical protein
MLSRISFAREAFGFSVEDLRHHGALAVPLRSAKRFPGSNSRREHAIRGSIMPIRPFLSGQAFDPETIQAMSDGFASVCSGLGLVERDDPATQLLARRIIDHAQRGVRSRADLYSLVLEEFSQKPE